MFPAKRELVSLSVVTLLCLVAPHGGGFAQDDAAGAEKSEPKLLEFKTKRHGDAYQNGLTQYNEGRFKEAAASFKQAAKGAANDEDKKTVERWELAANGGLLLEVLQRRAKAGQKRDALFEGLEIAIKFRGTEIEPNYDEFLGALSGEVLHILEDFEHPSGLFSKKYGKTHVKADPAKPDAVRHGEGCIEWAQTPDKKGSQLTIKTDVPPDWRRYEGVCFWIYAIKPVEMELVIVSPDKTTKAQINYYISKFTPRAAPRWELVYIPLTKFKKQGLGNLASVEKFVFNVRGRGDFHYRLDRVSLVRKDGAGPAS